jgi:hypothetical protein
MKYIHMFSHFHSGMLKCCRFLAGLKLSALTLQQVSHSNTYFAISCFILVHQNFFLKSLYNLLVPGWIEYLEQCALSLNHRTPSASCHKH